MTRVLLLALAACVSGCTSPYQYDPGAYVRDHGPEPSKDDIQSAKVAMFDCMLKTAPTLDDDRSDAKTIAVAVAGACSRQANEYARQRSWAFTDNTRRAYMADFHDAAEAAALTVVLQQRAARR